MKFIDEVDIELVNQELNFHSSDNNVVIRGGCDLFTTKPIASDRKLFKTIDKHLNQIIEDNQLSQTMGRERHYSMNSIASSASPPSTGFHSRQQQQQQHPQQQSQQQAQQQAQQQSHPQQQPSPRQSPLQQPLTMNTANEALSSSYTNDTSFESAVDESPFGPLKSSSTRKTFAYLIAILNTTYPDHDFSNLQPTEENFNRINTPEDLIHRFNNIMLSLGKKEDLLTWIWDTINVYMDLVPARSPTMVTINNGSRHGSVSTSRHNSVSTSRQNSVSALSTSKQNRSNSATRNTSMSPQIKPAQLNDEKDVTNDEKKRKLDDSLRDVNEHRHHAHHANQRRASFPYNSNAFEHCQIYEFQPSDQSILEDLNYPYQTLWSYYWFIYNKKKKRVSFLYLTAINKIHYSMVNRNRGSSFNRHNRGFGQQDGRTDGMENNDNGGDDDDDDDNDEEMYLNEYDDDVIIDDDEDEVDNDVVGDLEI